MNNDLTLRDYLRVLWSGRVLIAALVVIAAVIGLLTTVARGTQYTAQAQVSLGQATTQTGVPVQTYLTIPSTATTALKGDEIVGVVADKVGMSPAAVRTAITLTAPRVQGASAGNQPTLLTVTAVTGSQKKAVELANMYVDAIYSKVSAPFTSITKVYVEQRDSANALIPQLNKEIVGLRRTLTAERDAQRAVILQSALFSAQEQLRGVRSDQQTATIALEKAGQVERPTISSKAETASSSSAAPKRIRTALFAGLVGLILGIIATFVWKGSPAGRAREA